jgi:PBP1b-binding outer membrane lipoprotein LpoB
MNHMKNFSLLTAFAISLIGFTFCATEKKIEPTNPSNSVIDEANRNESVKEDEFEKYPEGFIDGNTFQVVVSSLKPESKDAEVEAISVAKKKSLQILLTYPKISLSDEGRKELKNISESGKITKRSGYNNSRMYFVYQIQKSNIEIYIKKQIK